MNEQPKESKEKTLNEIECPICKNKCSPNALTCPNCGEPFPFHKLNYYTNLYNEIGQINIDSTKSIIGWLIAISFSIIIFLISLFEEERTMFIDIGLVSLLLSTFFFFEGNLILTNAQIVLTDAKYDKSKKNKLLYKGNLKFQIGKISNYIGYYCFLLGILFLVSNFQMIILVNLIIAYIFYCLIKYILKIKNYIQSNLNFLKSQNISDYLENEKKIYIIIYIILLSILVFLGFLAIITSTMLIYKI